MFYIRQGSTFNNVLHSPRFYIQQCPTFNSVLLFSSTIEEDVVLVMMVMVFCFNYSVDNYNSDSDMFTS